MYEVYRRNTLLIPMGIKDENGAPVDITGCGLYFLVGKTIQKELSSGIEVVDSVEGQIEVTLTSDDTNMLPGYYSCELLVIDPDGNRWSGMVSSIAIRSNLSHMVEGSI